ncbi:MAG: LytTR family DNA-binding domain-containing protein [Allosphingosinicella sp.]
MSLTALPFVAAGLALAVALYCLAYTALAGRPEPFAEALGWAGANVLPWFAAFEAGKRFRAAGPRLAILAGAWLVSLGLGLGAGEMNGLAFEAVRQVPGLLLVALLWLIGDRIGLGAARIADDDIDLPLSPDQIDWVTAAGNYVEIRGRGRTIIRRMSLGAVERRLASHGFIRIHRSRLVRRERIARVRPDDVILHDGTSLKTGKRYRAALHG